MINEEKLKKLLCSIIVWTDLGSKPDVRKMVMKELNEAIVISERGNKTK